MRVVLNINAARGTTLDRRVVDEQGRDPDGKFASGSGGGSGSHADRSKHHSEQMGKAFASGSRMAGEHHREAMEHYSQASRYSSQAERETNPQAKKQLQKFAERSEKAGSASAEKARIAHEAHEAKRKT